jgi:hypothetical protein
LRQQQQACVDCRQLESVSNGSVEQLELKLATIVSILATIVAVGAISSLGGWAIKIRVYAKELLGCE